MMKESCGRESIGITHGRVFVLFVCQILVPGARNSFRGTCLYDFKIECDMLPDHGIAPLF